MPNMTNMTNYPADPDLIIKGVDEAFSGWLINHEISFPALLEQTIGNVFEQWLEDHETEIISAIAKQANS